MTRMVTPGKASAVKVCQAVKRTSRMNAGPTAKRLRAKSAVRKESMCLQDSKPLPQRPPETSHRWARNGRDGVLRLDAKPSSSDVA